MEPIQVTLLSNGWGKVIQTQKWGEVEGTPQCVVSGKAVDDCFGRTVMTYHPFTIPITPQTAYYDSTLNGTQTEIRYDILGCGTAGGRPAHGGKSALGGGADAENVCGTRSGGCVCRPATPAAKFLGGLRALMR